MTIQSIKKDRYHIDFTCNAEAIDNALVVDLKEIFCEYLNEFSSQINSEIWDYFAVEFWFDSGQLIFFPEKKINEPPTEYDPFPADRLDPYLIIRLTSYLKKYDAFMEHEYDSLSESAFINWHLKKCREVFDNINLALDESEFSNFILKSLNKKNIVFRYFGTSRETIYGDKVITFSK